MENRFRIDKLEDRIAPASYFIPGIHFNFHFSFHGYTISAVSSSGGTTISLTH
jgi:hypothetical protein